MVKITALKLLCPWSYHYRPKNKKVNDQDWLVPRIHTLIFKSVNHLAVQCSMSVCVFLKLNLRSGLALPLPHVVYSIRISRTLTQERRHKGIYMAPNPIGISGISPCCELFTWVQTTSIMWFNEIYIRYMIVRFKPFYSIQDLPVDDLRMDRNSLLKVQ